MMQVRCIAGRAIAWRKAHRKEDPETPLVIKDSWQYTDWDGEGKLLQELRLLRKTWLPSLDTTTTRLSPYVVLMTMFA